MNTTRFALVALAAVPGTAMAQPYTITARALTCGGATTPAPTGPYSLACSMGDPAAWPARAAGAYVVATGFLAVAQDPEAAACYANCDASTTPPVLNVLDFSCFLNEFAAGNPIANCDDSTTPPVLNVLDFSCFLNMFAAGCP